MSSKINKWWDEKRILWYDRASLYSPFQENLTRLIEKHIPIEESILELGTGLGYQGENLCKRGYDIASFDIDEDAIACARKRSNLPIFQLKDYREIKEKRDAVLSVFFGRITEDDNLDFILSLANKHLVYVQSCHRGQSKDLRKKGDNTERTIRYLEDRGIDFSYSEHKIPFPQPFESLDEAKLFITSFYGEERLGSYLQYVNETGREDLPFELKNDKEFIIFDIKKEDR